MHFSDKPEIHFPCGGGYALPPAERRHALYVQQAHNLVQVHCLHSKGPLYSLKTIPAGMAQALREVNCRGTFRSFTNR